MKSYSTLLLIILICFMFTFTSSFLIADDTDYLASLHDYCLGLNEINDEKTCTEEFGDSLDKMNKISENKSILKVSEKPCSCDSLNINSECVFGVSGFDPGWYYFKDMDLIIDQINKELSLWNEYEIVNIRYTGYSDSLNWAKKSSYKPRDIFKSVIQCVNSRTQKKLSDFVGYTDEEKNRLIALLRGCKLRELVLLNGYSFNIDLSEVVAVLNSNKRNAELSFTIINGCENTYE